MNKKLKISIVAMAMVFVLLVGNILAYFTDADTATNEFTTGRISIDLQEPNWDPSLGGELVPGYEIPKDPQVLNDGINDAFIFVTVEVPYQNVTTTDEEGNKLQPTDTELFSYDVKEGWVQVGEPVVDTENSVVKYVYAYAKDDELTPLEPGNTTPTVFDFIQFEDVIEDEGLEDLKLDVVVKAYAIQTDNIDGGKTDPAGVWSVMDTSSIVGALEDVVIDYGLPVVISQTKIGNTPFVEEECWSEYGELDIEGDNSSGAWSVKYTPTEILQGIDTVHLIAEDGEEFTFNVYPATTMYYEDDFLIYEDSIVATDEFGKWNVDGETITGKIQSENKVGKKNLSNIKNNIYGYDDAYLDCNTYSLGSAHEVTISSSEMALANCPTASFVFTGSSFDIFFTTSNKTGGLIVRVYDMNNNYEQVASWLHNSYYGTTYTLNENAPYLKRTSVYGNDNKWHVTTEEVAVNILAPDETGIMPSDPKVGDTFVTFELNYIATENLDASNDLYQIPVIESPQLKYSTYKVTIIPRYSTMFDNAKAGHYKVSVDSVRIYNTCGLDEQDSNNVYKIDKELYPEFVEVRHFLLDQGSFGDTEDFYNNVVFIDGFGTVETIAEYKKHGPNNEVYLLDSQGIAFRLKNSDYKNIESVQIGLKSINGENSLITVEDKDGASKSIPISSATDMFYDITDCIKWEDGKTGLIKISNSADDGVIASITDLKITYKDAPTDSTSALITREDVDSFAD